VTIRCLTELVASAISN